MQIPGTPNLAADANVAHRRRRVRQIRARLRRIRAHQRAETKLGGPVRYPGKQGFGEGAKREKAPRNL